MRILLSLALALALAACGVKSDLLLPNGQATPKHQPDPSRPSQPIGQ
ncbi:MAG TPA: lipoprotein [Rhizomicrobium sp.]|jgi:predicted small lipoprotein YifL|nr:lipoprotein [Rhizomicrobium sp.]